MEAIFFLHSVCYSGSNLITLEIAKTALLVVGRRRGDGWGDRGNEHSVYFYYLDFVSTNIGIWCRKAFLKAPYF